MRFAPERVIQVSLASAFLETGAAVLRSHSFYVIQIIMFALIEVVFYVVVICAAAFILSRIRITAPLAQKVAFIILVIAPSVFSYYLFYRGVSDYRQGGGVLVADHMITTAGIESFALSVVVSVGIGLVATMI